MRTKVKVAVLVGTVAVAALACFLLGYHRGRDDQVSLTFQSDSDLYAYVGDVAFLFHIVHPWRCATDARR